MIRADLCVIGAGSGGLSVAAGAAQLGLGVVLVERSEMGGDCLNTGCIPSKALLAAARRAETHRKTDIAGIAGHEPEIDFAAVKDHVAKAIATIAPHDSVKRFEGLGVTVIKASAVFTGRDTISVDIGGGGKTVKARHFVIATGSRPAMPPIPGLDDDRILTNESIFTLRDRPDHLLVIGAGPIGIEMAQAHRRLGSQVSVFDMGPILPRDEPENVAILRNALRNEGINVHENVSVNAVDHGDRGHRIILGQDGRTLEIDGSHILIAAGRTPVTDGLGLDAAGISHDSKGIRVDARLRTTNKRVFAIGDVAGGPQFTHIAGYHAGIVIRNICFRLPARVDYRALPWVTYADPELAQVGLTETMARNRYGNRVRATTAAFEDNDRAVTEAAREGQIKIVTDQRGRVLGVSMVGPHAGELIGLWALALSKRLKLSAVAGLILPYPTFGEISKRAAGAWYTPGLFSDRTRRVVRWLRKLPF